MSTRRVPLWLDAWAWVTAGGVLPLFLFSRGAPRGEPVAEDFDFLHRAWLETRRSWLDGGGSQAFWRPVSHQLYYRTIGSWALAEPGLVAVLHGLLLAFAAVLLYRAFRLSWSGPAAAALATFPLLAESTRTLIAWPSHFVDVGAFVFLAVAIHEVVFGRLGSSLIAVLAALGSKEIALGGALLLPFLPTGAPAEPRARVRYLLGIGAVVVAWAGLYQWVRARAGLEMPHGLERDASVLAVPITTRVGWALWNSLRATFSLSLAHERHGSAALLLFGLLAVVVAIVFARSARARARLHARRGWIAWGLAWCAIEWLALSSIYPLWAPNRSQLGSLGCGLLLVTLAYAAHPSLALALVVVRVGFFALGPGTPRTITPVPDDRGAFMDYPRLVRLQSLMRLSREQLTHRYPTLPRGSRIGVHSLPLLSEYAYGRGHAVQVWYRDSTLAFVPYRDFEKDPSQPIVTFLGYQANHRPQIVLLEPASVREEIAGLAALRDGRWSESSDHLARADSLQTDRSAVVFLGDVAGIL